jgi:hypothetical protein
MKQSAGTSALYAKSKMNQAEKMGKPGGAHIQIVSVQSIRV